MFVFYDTETTGLDKNFTQIVQIALVFTDADLNILSVKKLQCRNSPWVVPSPGALLTTGFEPDDLKFTKLSNYEMMNDANAWLEGKHWPLTFVGYNSNQYDEDVLAQNFYQNLLDPNLTSSKNDSNTQCNGRADVMTMVKAVALYMPGVLKLDIKNSFGDPSLTLQNVAQQNGVTLGSEDAHDAMNDTKATVGVGKLVQKAAPQIWSHMMKLSTVDGVNEFLAGNDVFTNATSRGKPKVMTSLVEREGSTTQALFDLSVDPAPYLKMSVEELKDVLLQKQKERPITLVRKNSQPTLMPLDLSEPVLPANYDEKLFATRAKALKDDKQFLERVAKAALLAKEVKLSVPTQPLPELAIHQKIAAPVQKRIDQWLNEFNATSEWSASAKLVEDFKTRFKDEMSNPAVASYAQFAERIVFEHAPHELSAKKQEELKKEIAARVLNPSFEAPYMTVAKARAELKKIEEQRSKGKWSHVTDTQIRSLKLYYTSIEKEYAGYMPKPVNDNKPAAPSTAKKTFNGPSGPKV